MANISGNYVDEYTFDKNDNNYVIAVQIKENTTFGYLTTGSMNNAWNINEIWIQDEPLPDSLNNYTNAKNYMIGYIGNSDLHRVKAIKNMFSPQTVTNGANPQTDAMSAVAMNWTTETVWFQDNKTEAIQPSKVTICTSTNDSGCEPMKEFYITASATGDFTDEVTIYTGVHTLTTNHPNTNSEKISVHNFTTSGSYKYFRLYVTSWYPSNAGDGSSIIQCYIE